MNSSKVWLALTTVVASLGVTVIARADTVKARCDVYPKGIDQATSSGLCTFSQRQGYVGIQLQNGKRYDLSPVGNQPSNYQDQNGQAAYRQAGLGDKGQIYRLASESIYVYWDTSPYNNPGNRSNAGGSLSKSRLATLTATSGSQINVRSQPTIKSATPHYGVAGDRVQIIRCVQDQDTPGSELNWCNVRFVQSKATGWVRSDFISFSDGGE